ncbi:MAG: DUF922 domain-containing protein [Nitrospira sp.]|nr:DUF922 domain-containing protein [Nitrospira sp.]
MTEDEQKAQGVDPDKGILGYTEPGWAPYYGYYADNLSKAGDAGNGKVCLKVTKLTTVTYQAKPQMHRINWKHNWPEASQCAQEWNRVVEHVETHERTHAKHAEEIAKEVEKTFSQEVKTKFLATRDFPIICDSTMEQAKKE